MQVFDIEPLCLFKLLQKETVNVAGFRGDRKVE